MVDDVDFALHTVVETLRLLALPADDQIAALPDYVVVADELALIWDEDCRHLLRPLVDVGRISPDDREHLDQLDRLLSEMSDGPSEEWTVDALRSSPRWEECRVIASTGLARLGASAGPPMLDWISYVPGRAADPSES